MEPCDFARINKLLIQEGYLLSVIYMPKKQAIHVALLHDNTMKTNYSASGNSFQEATERLENRLITDGV